MFGISVASLFFYHLFLSSQNRTTIGEDFPSSSSSHLIVRLESFRSPIFATGPEKDGFHLGGKRNFQQIFGLNFFKALVPISTTCVRSLADRRGTNVWWPNTKDERWETLSNKILSWFAHPSIEGKETEREREMQRRRKSEEILHLIRKILSFLISTSLSLCSSNDVLIPMDNPSTSSRTDRPFQSNSKITPH